MLEPSHTIAKDPANFLRHMRVTLRPHRIIRLQVDGSVEAFRGAHGGCEKLGFPLGC